MYMYGYVSPAEASRRPPGAYDGEGRRTGTRTTTITVTDRDEGAAPVTLFCTDTATATTGDAVTVTDRMAERHGTTRVAVVPESAHDVHLDGPAAV
ncbi:hypothetical protein [Streptomyces sp. SAI-25]|uniref:hypothetical protein n=1 Tax=Streptomyces sp. SAI-25 TaxID=1472664 RepID=UPI00403A6D07